LGEITAFIKLKLSECDTSHQKCSATLTGTRTISYPDRLLDLRRVSQDLDVGPTLIETQSSQWKNSGTQHYVALSHCWGKEPLLKTKKSNYDSFKESVCWSCLPRTFQDAILVARCLEVDFIWIDSLCIIQDDALDWAKQASKMGTIYDNAHITLCATGAKDGATGLFFDRTDVHTIAGTHEGISYTIYVRQMLYHGAFENVKEHDSSKANQHGYRQRDLPGQKRGWIAQEQLLSRRAIHFTQEELVWDCRETVECECNSITEHTFGAPNFKQSVLAGLYEIKVAWFSWTEMLKKFVVRDFSKDYDRLPALSGLAQRFERCSGAKLGHYCAGLWRSELPIGLMWVAVHPGQRCLMTNEGGLVSSPPSWSWAAMKPMSLDWPEFFSLYQFKIDIIDVETYHSTQDTKGMLIGGRIYLEGRLLPLRVSWPETRSCKPTSTYPFRDISYRFMLLEGDGQGETEPSALRNHGKISPDVALADDGVISGQTVYFLHVAEPRHQFGHISSDAPHGLFLVQTGIETDTGITNCSIDAGSHVVQKIFRRIGNGVVCSAEGVAALEGCARERLIIV
jgi:hypothetical protein